MIIDLPKKFPTANIKSKERKAWIKDGILYMKPCVNFDRIMYELTYAIKGKRQCYYCRRKITKDTNITLDHIYPKAYGGPTIPNNLEPSCFKCNCKKSDLTAEEFAIYNSLDKNQKAKFLSETMKEKEKIRRKVGYNVPKEFVTMKKTAKLRAFCWEEVKGKKYRQVKKQYMKYGTLKRPIVTDRNLIVIDGFSVYLFAKENGITEVPVIELQNVEVVK